MSKPYLVISDLHFHEWSAFAEMNEGVNSRLQRIIDAVRESAQKLRAVGGDTMFIAGDVFHRRGEIAPAVLNTVTDLFAELCRDLKVYAIPGNHDLTANDSQRVGNAVTALESVGVIVAHDPMVVELDELTRVVLFPWYSSLANLTGAMDSMRIDLMLENDEYRLHAIIHAPIDGVLPHLPAHGLGGADLASIGYDLVLSGHYHNHKDMSDGVYSVGALTNQTWGDIGSLAGFILVDPNENSVEHFETQHPKFVELTGDETEDEAAAKCKGNYVRVRAEIEKDAELKEIRDGVMTLGALGCVVIPQRKTVIARSGVTTSSSSASIEASIKGYLDKRGASAEVHALALDVLSEARA